MSLRAQLDAVRGRYRTRKRMENTFNTLASCLEARRSAERERERRRAERERKERKEIISALLSRGVPRSRFEFHLTNDEDDPLDPRDNSFDISIGDNGLKARVLIDHGDRKWTVADLNSHDVLEHPWWESGYNCYYIRTRPFFLWELSVDTCIEKLLSIIKKKCLTAEEGEALLYKRMSKEVEKYQEGS